VEYIEKTESLYLVLFLKWLDVGKAVGFGSDLVALRPSTENFRAV